MKRRKFLEALGAGAAGISAYSCADRDEAERLRATLADASEMDLTWTKAPCRYCGTGCAWRSASGTIASWPCAATSGAR